MVRKYGKFCSETERRQGAQRVEFRFSMRDGERAIECSVSKKGKFILRKPKEIGCSESRILLLNARWKESYRVLSEKEREIHSQKERGDRVLREWKFAAQCEMEKESYKLLSEKEREIHSQRLRGRKGVHRD